METKTAIVTGVGGMDGFYLSHHLLQLDYNVVGVLRRSANINDSRLKTLYGSPNFHTVYGDITDAASMNSIVEKFNPTEFYHLAANSFVKTSWDSPAHYIETNTIGTINCLEALKQYQQDCKFYFAGSSEMYGDILKRNKGVTTLDEDSPMVAASPYGVSKVAGYQMTKVYRESYDMFTTCGILFNHSAPLRGTEFFTRKVTSQLSKIKWDVQDGMSLGNLSASRDEGFSYDYVKAMHKMLQHKEPDDFVIATGETHSCQEWLDKAMAYFKTDKQCINIDRSLFRPNEVSVLMGDASKAESELGWKRQCSFDDLVEMMCEYDYHLQCPDPHYYRRADEFLF